MKPKPVGKILTKTSSREFSFVATEYFEGDFVEVRAPHRRDSVVVAEIVKKEGINTYLDTPEVMSFISEADEEITSFNMYVFTATPIAVVSREDVRPVDFPLPPGGNVYAATEDRVNDALGITTGDVKIGRLDKSPKPVIRISIDALFRPHAAVLGRTGSGKSYFVRGLSKHIRDRRIVILSPTDEYNDIGEECGMQVFSREGMLLPSKPDFIASVCGLSLQEEMMVKAFLNESPVQGRVHSGELADQLKRWVIERASGSARRHRATQMAFLGPEKTEPGGLEELRVPGYADSAVAKLRSKSIYFSSKPLKVPFDNSAVLDMSEVEEEVQEIIIGYILHNILHAYRSKKRKASLPRILIIIEEVHNFAPSVRTTRCKDKIVQVAREGRKLGIGLCLVSQRPRHFDQTILSQCTNLFLFHIPHPDDINHVFGVSPFYSPHYMDVAQRLDVGKCLIIGNVLHSPVLCAIDFAEND